MTGEADDAADKVGAGADLSVAGGGKPANGEEL